MSYFECHFNWRFWGEGETPAQIFLAHWRFKKKWYKLSKLGGGGLGGGRGNLDKIQNNSYFFRETVPNMEAAIWFEDIKTYPGQNPIGNSCSGNLNQDDGLNSGGKKG